jgi:hypothetical protein
MLILVMKLLGWLSGSLPGVLSFAQNVLGKVSSDATVRYQAATQAGTAITQATLAADVEVAKLKDAENARNMGWWVTAWEKPILFYLCLLHFGAIMLDTTFHMGWRIPSPPDPYGTWEGVIILSDVVMLTTTTLTSRIVTAIWK